ncbi:hypothetical protein [Levilactobacillus yonginensis]|nr:hypothetical protein [Levilactobacillus yonginensis]
MTKFNEYDEGGAAGSVFFDAFFSDALIFKIKLMMFTISGGDQA